MVYKNIIKVFFDMLVSLVVLVLASPILIILIIILSIDLKGTPFFFQKRPGKQGRIFSIVKFKTMTNERDDNGHLLPDAQRLTLLGKIVRKTSLDELPQLINVLKGNMSIVGPRPLLPKYLELYSDYQKQRHNVKPGITGWAQVNGRNTISYTEKFKLDVWYVNNLSFMVDLKIIFKTVEKVFKGSDINAENQATTLPFDGTN